MFSFMQPFFVSCVCMQGFTNLDEGHDQLLLDVCIARLEVEMVEMAAAGLRQDYWLRS